ncbi:MAG TPA: wax ester/triacylglycerol synthase domain-containing protein [Pseudonocardia sp.]
MAGAVGELDPWGWGGAAQMSAWEALMWRAEGDLRTRSSGVLLELLDTAPDWNRLRDAHERATHVIPRLRDRVVEPALPVTTPVWTEDTNFDLDYHLQRSRLPEPGSMRQLLDLAGHVASRPLDVNRPPWEAVLVEGLADGKAAYVLKLHHSLSDGLGFMQLLGLSHSRTAAPGGQPIASVPPAPPRSDQPPPTPLGLVGSQLREDLTGLPARAVGTAGAAIGLLGRALKDPIGSLTEAVDYGRSLVRVLSPPASERSPLLRAGGGFSYCLLTYEMTLNEVKAAGKAVGGSVNDVFLAGILGAFRRYHEFLGQPIEQMPISIPISLRDSNDPAGGNRWAGARLVAPVGEPDPRRRMLLIREQILAARQEPAIAFMEFLAPALNRLPSAALTEIAGGMTNVSDVQASNVPGLGFPVYLAGARVRRTFAMGPRPGVSAMITMVSYDGVCCLGVNLDPDSITDVPAFERCLHEGFTEVLELSGAGH